MKGVSALNKTLQSASSPKVSSKTRTSHRPGPGYVSPCTVSQICARHPAVFPILAPPHRHRLPLRRGGNQTNRLRQPISRPRPSQCHLIIANVLSPGICSAPRGGRHHGTTHLTCFPAGRAVGGYVALPRPFISSPVCLTRTPASPSPTSGLSPPVTRPAAHRPRLLVVLL
jgi:hypothetical protein